MISMQVAEYFFSKKQEISSSTNVEHFLYYNNARISPGLVVQLDSALRLETRDPGIDSHQTH